MATERVKINTNLFQINNSSGTPVFSSDFKYIKTQSPGTMNLAVLSTSPAPYVSSTTLNDDSGHPFAVQLNPTQAIPYQDIFTAPANGILSIRPTVVVYVGQPNGVVIDSTDRGTGNFVTLYKNGNFFTTLTYELRLVLIPFQQGQLRPAGQRAMMDYKIDVSLNTGDVISVYLQSSTLSTSTTWVIPATNLYGRFFSSNVTLPLQVTT